MSVRKTLWRAIALAVAALSFSGGVLAQAAPPTPPKLVVVIVVDQFSAELFSRYRDSFTGGLKRMSEGLSFADGYQSHAATETCPGHSTVLTGRHPAATGIVANTWFDVKTGSTIYCVSVAGTSDPNARGPDKLKVSTFGDWLKAAEPGARVVSISGKDRAAIMLGGHHADAVYWWVDGEGFATSRYAGPADRTVTAPAEAFDKALFKAWRAAPPALWPATLPADCQALEAPHRFGKLAVSGHVPPEASLTVEGAPDFVTNPDFHNQLRFSPAFDPVTLDFAADVAAARGLGRGPATDLLAVSLSSTDFVGHRYGNGGAEMCAQMHALDAGLGAFFAKLDAMSGPYVVVLTADHGAIDAAERAAEKGVAAERIDAAALVTALNRHLEKVLDIPYEPIVGDDPEQLFINTPPDPAFHAKVSAAAVAWLKAQPQVAQVFTAAEIAAAAPAPGTGVEALSLAERFHESYDPERSGDVIVAFKQYSTLGMPRSVGDNVAGHGSPWDHDRRVPILFWRSGIAAERRPEPIETVDIAPTLAAIAGVVTPRVDGRCLSAVTAACAP
jgi:predicted AlkP superfamily pyrophosphatase or phosphodiesterase